MDAELFFNTFLGAKPGLFAVTQEGLPVACWEATNSGEPMLAVAAEDSMDSMHQAILRATPVSEYLERLANITGGRAEWTWPGLTKREGSGLVHLTVPGHAEILVTLGDDPATVLAQLA